MKTKFTYLLPAIASLIIFIWYYRIWDYSLNIPLNYSSDSLWSLEAIKSLIQNHGFFVNPSLGAPTGAVYYDYPHDGILLSLLLITLTFLSNNTFLVINLFYLLSFMLIASSAFIVFKFFNISTILSLGGSLLYAFLPYHLIRGENHLYLSSYFIIPLSILVMLWILLSHPYKRKKYYSYSLIIGILSGFSGIYYAFFSAILFLASGVISFNHRKKKQIILLTILLVFIILGTLAISVAPTIFYRIKNGVNSFAYFRHPVESEIYGLRMIQLFIPLGSYKFTPLMNLRTTYLTQSLVGRGEATEYLGIIGIIGYISLLVVIFLNKIKNIHFRILQSLSYLNLIALLIGITTGFGTMFAYTISPNIRAYNRISVFIAFFSIFASLILCQYLYKRIKSRLKKRVYLMLLLFLFIFALFDQIYWLRPGKKNQAATKAEFKNNQSFIEEIEKLVPKNTMIFQLPYKAFPESLPINRLKDYDLLLGYLHSDNLRWSYGSPKGRKNDKWLIAMTSLPIDEMVKRISKAGFGGIYIDRFGYKDDGVIIEAKLKELLNRSPIISNNNRLIFFPMLSY